MSISVEDVKKLKKMTGVGLTSAKKALEEANGDFDKAVEAMRIKGMAKADEKAGRDASAGMVHSYVHGDKIGVLVELNCETDFVARTDELKALANDLALHIAASAPKYLDVDDISEQDLKKEKELLEAEMLEAGKDTKMIGQIVEGKLKKWQTEVCLLKQPFVKDPDKAVEEVIKATVAKLGENIVLRQFARIELGGS